MINVVSNPDKLSSAFARKLLLTTAALSLTACSSLAEKMPWSNHDPVDYALISTNLVDAVSQYPRLSPLLATVQVTAPDNVFERQVHAELSERGFKLEPVSDERGANGINATIRNVEEDPAHASPLYVLSIGDMSVERRFGNVDGRTFPSSELVLRGFDERTITLNDAELFDGFDAAYSAVAFKPYDGPEIGDVLKPSTKNASVSGDDVPDVVKHNMYDTMTSNFVEVFTDYEDVEQSILVFPNDSLRLGDANKRIIEEYVSMMNSETDVLSVIGCSHGQTDISNGNSVLAIGRANRVKEALMFSGIEHDLVMEEGCWAPRLFDEVMPRRGVVLTLKRDKSS